MTGSSSGTEGAVGRAGPCRWPPLCLWETIYPVIQPICTYVLLTYVLNIWRPRLLAMQAVELCV